MKQIYVLGDGQLGRMLRQAAEPLGILVKTINDTTTKADLPAPADVITAEIEHWTPTPLTRHLESQPNFINRDIFPLIADRHTQKQLLDHLNLPTAPWCLLESPQSIHNLPTAQNLIVKRRSGGYDGRGQWRVTPSTLNTLPPDCYGQSIIEHAIDFCAELSLIGARHRQGHCTFYPLTHNFHQAGILRASLATRHHPRQQQAQTLLTAIMEHLNYIGVMAMECFLTPRGLLINELAPRVHNSGHWTQNGASISQFALHLCAILDLPCPAPQATHPAAMINLIGCPLDYRWLNVPHCHLHWYHKLPRPGRKLGHLNLTPPTPAALNTTLQTLRPLLPPDHHPAIDWLQSRQPQ